MRSDPLKILGERIRELRKVRRMSQEQLGALANLHRNEIGVVERGEVNLTFINMLRICAALALTPSELLKPFDIPESSELPKKRSQRKEK